MNERLVVCIRDRAAVHFYQFEEVRKALRFFDERPQELAWRVEELDRVVLMVNGLLPAPQLIDSAFVNLKNLVEAINPNASMPTLTELQGTQDLVEATFVDMQQEIASGKLNLPQASDQLGRPASTLLVEGYGLLLEKHFQTPGLGAIFVLACEEMLVTYMHESRLFEDLFDQMLGHKEMFSPKIQRALSTA